MPSRETHSERTKATLCGYPGAEAALELLGVRPGETVLILSDARVDEEPLRILQDAVLRHDAHPVVARDLPTAFSEELSPAVEDRLRESDVVLLAASNSFYHATARKRAKREWGKRVAECYGIVTANLAEGALTADYREVARLGKELHEIFQGTKTLRVLTEAGTDFTIRILRAGYEDGNYRRPGSGGNLPAGEVFLIPEPGTAHGRVVFDLSMDLAGTLRGGPTGFDVRSGEIQCLFGPGAPVLQEALRRDRRVGRIAELAFGTNAWAKLGRNVLEDEKKFGTGHVGFGNDTYFGGRNGGPHYDGVFLGPTAILDKGRRTLSFR